MRETARIVIDVEIDNDNPNEVTMNEMTVEGSLTTLSIALLAAAYGTIDPSHPLDEQVKVKVLLQQAIAHALFNGTVSMMGKGESETTDLLKGMLGKLTDANATALKYKAEQYKNRQNGGQQQDEQDDKGGNGRVDFSDFT